MATVRDWIRGLNPTDTIPQLQYTSNVNQASTCNAFFNGSSINFFLAGGGPPGGRQCRLPHPWRSS